LAGLGRKEFNSGDILLASEVQGYLQDQAVMVFDDATARGSAIPSPSEGMLTYNKATDQLELYDGSAFGPVGSDAGLIHIDTVTWSAVTGFSLPNDTFTTDYDNYLIIASIDVSTGVNASYRFRTSGTDNSTSNYTSQGTSADGSSITAGRTSNETSNRLSFLSTSGNIVRLEIFAPKLSARTGVISTSNVLGVSYGEYLAQNFNSTTVFDSLSFLFGAATSSGKAYIYGYKN
jgi:hypothetical protein